VLGVEPSEFLVLLVVAVVIIGPKRLPQYTQQLASWVRRTRDFVQQTVRSAKAEMGPEFDEVDWRKLDPRQYDPRRIVREALSEVIDPNDPLGLADPPRRPSPSSSPASEARGRGGTDREGASPDLAASGDTVHDRAADDRPPEEPASGPARPDRPVAFDPDAT
jgi:sec-independent protein translocase protein TatB